MNRRKILRFSILALLLIPLTASPVKATISGTHPVVVVLCNFINQQVQPNPPSYYQHMFSDAGAGELGALDYWHDVSETSPNTPQFSISGTVVLGWYTLSITRDTWATFPGTQAQARGQEWSSCASKAEQPSVNLHNFQDIIAIFPEARSTLASQIGPNAFQITVSSTTVGDAANFPSPPFLLCLTACFKDSNGNPPNAEIVSVTAISGTTFTIQRGQRGTTAASHASGDAAVVPGDIFGFPAGDVCFQNCPQMSNHYNLGGVVGMHDLPLSIFTHEMGHGFGFNHSRRLSTSTTDYNDCYDIMSAMSCIYAFSGGGTGGTAFGGNPFGGFSKGPGLNAIQLDLAGWIDASRETTFSGSQTTYTFAALNHPEASGNMEVRIPAAVIIPTPQGEDPSGTHTSDYYTIELRSKTGWDRGIPQDAFVLHLEANSRSYWVDSPFTLGSVTGTLVSHNGGLYAGDEYVDASNNAYVAVNAIDPTTFTGVITLASSKIKATLTYTGDTSADYHDTATLSGDLMVSGTTAPVPFANVVFTLGSQSCPATTDSNGHASCPITPNQAAGSYSVTASFSGDNAYQPATDTQAFLINKEETTLTFNGPTVILQGGTGVTLSARLLEDGVRAPVPFSQTVTLGLGSQSCMGTTDATGTAKCLLVFNGPLGPEPLSATFSGDAYYKPSSDTSKTAIVFAFPSSGAFVLGDQTVATASQGTTVTWWSDTWSSQNSLSRGPAPPAFKGFAGTVNTLPTSSPAAHCGGNWTTTGGNSPPPTSDVPSYMGILVAKGVTKTGSTITGDFFEIVVVKINPGYGPMPDTPGTGTIVAIFCP